MESIESALNEGLEPNKSPESQMAAHQVREQLWRMSPDILEVVFMSVG